MMSCAKTGDYFGNGDSDDDCADVYISAKIFPMNFVKISVIPLHR